MESFKNYTLILIVILFSSNCENINSKKTIIVKGTIGNHFHLSSTENIEKDKREDFLKEADDVSGRIEKLDKYYRLINNGKKEEANDIIESDSVLLKTNQFGIAMGYMIIKMKELNVLFKPMIQCHGFNETHLISITENELILLEKYLNKRIEVELVIYKIGDIEMDKTSIYKIMKIN